MRCAALIALAVLGGCAKSETDDEDRVLYRLQGALDGVQDIEAPPTAEVTTETLDQADNAFGTARIGCTLVNVTDKNPGKGQTFVLSAVQNYGETHAAGLYLKIDSFVGVGSYALEGNGRAWVFDKGHVQACARSGDRSCYQGVEGCTMDITRWDFSPGVASRPAGYPASVTVGMAEGTFSCRKLVNETTSTSVSIVSGSFRCHASDWTH